MRHFFFFLIFQHSGNVLRSPKILRFSRMRQSVEKQRGQKEDGRGRQGRGDGLTADGVRTTCGQRGLLEINVSPSITDD